MSLGVICSAASVNESIPADTLTSNGALPPGELQNGKVTSSVFVQTNITLCKMSHWTSPLTSVIVQQQYTICSTLLAVQSLCMSVMVKRKLCHEVKILIYWLNIIFKPSPVVTSFIVADLAVLGDRTGRSELSCFVKEPLV